MMLDITMQENSFKGNASRDRFGVHYFPDSEHYTTADMLAWLPKLQAMGANWAILQATAERAIPEDFIRSLAQAGIEPVLHFQLPLDNAGADAEMLRPLFEAYAKWGVRYAVLFDKPNLRSQWPATGWTQRGLVPRFLELFTPLAQAALDAGLIPVFPPLEPGGDYWDTAFVRGALEALAQQGHEMLLNNLALGAYAWAGDKGLTWGEGGPERWPATLPYSTPENSQDQRGFRIFDWYNAVSQAAIGHTLPIVLVATGMQAEGDADAASMQSLIAALKSAELPSNVIASGVWLLAAEADSAAAGQAWFSAKGLPQPLAEVLLEPGRLAAHSFPTAFTPEDTFPEADVETTHAVSHSLPAIEMDDAASAPVAGRAGSIRHYLLLPDANWPLQQAMPFIAHYQPTIGFSLEEAKLAQRVTLAGGLDAFSDTTLRELIAAGCQVNNLPSQA
ncbi:MAG TPA: hypothetical protein PLC52_00550 [Anaerolineales bacterium]|nr:hypothetical protein [Anaerolineales bacterium]HRQ91343.1 hypothetical protein [Anaerolineales bacterium]